MYEGLVLKLYCFRKMIKIFNRYDNYLFYDNKVFK